MGAGLGLLVTAVMALGGPHAAITDGPSGTIEQTTATFAFEAEGGTGVLATFECRLDGGPWDECSSPKSIGGLGGGPHRFEVRLTGTLTDPTPDHRDWVVEQRTVVTPAPVAPAPEAPVIAPPPRVIKRRDAGGCAYAGNEPGEARPALLRAAAICLIDGERHKRGLRAVHRSRALERAATDHARDMVTRRYFSHFTPTGRGVPQRVAATGYIRANHAWTLGEVLAWLVRPRPTPAATVDAWMHSPPHRAVLLRPSFRDIGVGFARGNPRSGQAGATWAGELGRR